MNKKQTTQKSNITYDQIVQTLRETQLIVRETIEERKKTEKITAQEMKEFRESLRESLQVSLHVSLQESLQTSLQESLQTFLQESLQASIKELSEERKKREKIAEQEMKDIRASIKRFSDQMGKLGNRFGDLIEHIVLPGIIRRFNELDYQFNEEIHGLKIRDKKNIVLAEIDIILENGSVIAVVEVKANPEAEDIKDFLKRIEIFYHNRKDKLENKKVIGAIAGAIFPQNVRDYAIKNGLYVLKQSGDTMKMDVPKNFKPREFSFE
ncbi:MAG: hypothetical protein LBB88_05400 [Planctomycetaceae bacterium]|jgi:hypothetical protein|nr:hypothetical protein [Planctomycetaceae bacterium]